MAVNWYFTQATAILDLGPNGSSRDIPPRFGNESSDRATFVKAMESSVVGYFEFDAGGSRKFISKVAFVETGSPK